MRDLTDAEIRSFRDNDCCPFCSSKEFSDPREGGASLNLTCDGCGARFNLYLAGSVWGGQLISGPTESADA